MLHLLFSNNGLDRVKDILRPTDQVVQLSSERILLVDTAKYLESIKNQNAKDSVPEIMGEEIDQAKLVNIINNAPSIKSTY